MMDTAKAFVRLGLRDAGYQFINMDDGWQSMSRANNGTGPQMADPVKFPLGMGHLAERLHSMDLRLGLYTALASNTCGGRVGSCRHEALDAQQYADWKVDYLKDDGCGGCYESTAPGDPALMAYAVMQAGINEAGRPMYFSTEASPNLTKNSERPDLYGNTHRSGHDSVPNWQSVISQIDIASGLSHLVHNDTGHGGFFTDMDMLQVGQGDFPNHQLPRIRTHFGMWALLKSTLLISTVLDWLEDPVVQILGNKHLIGIHQDTLVRPAKRVASTRPEALELTAPNNANLAVSKCEAGNPLQLWRFEGNETNVGRLWTQDKHGQRWCTGEVNWARPGQVYPCDAPEYQPVPNAPCGCNSTEPCCHRIDSYSTTACPTCLAGVPKPIQCNGDSNLGGMVGEGDGCVLHMECAEADGVIQSIDFADWGLPHNKGANNSLQPGACDDFVANASCTFTNGKALAYVKSICEGKHSCNVDSSQLQRYVGDPCSGIHKRLAVKASGCKPNRNPPANGHRVNFSPPILWDSTAGASGPLPHTRYTGASPMEADVGDVDAWYFSSPNGSEHPSGAHWLQPSMRHWPTADGGTILDDDHVGTVEETPAKEWCAEAMAVGNLEVWSGPLTGGRIAVGLLNRSPKEANITVHWAHLALDGDVNLSVLDAWAGQSRGEASGSHTQPVAAQDTAVLILGPPRGN